MQYQNYAMGGVQQAQPQLNYQYRFQVVSNLIRNMLPQITNDQRIQQALLNNISPNVPGAALVQDLNSTLDRLATPDAWNRGIQDQDIVRALTPWLVAHCQAIQQRIYGAQPMMGMGVGMGGMPMAGQQMMMPQSAFANPYAAGQAVGSTALPSTTSMYDTSTAATQQPQQPVQQAQPQPVQQQPQQPAASSISSAWNKPMTTQQQPPAQPIQLQWRTAPAADIPAMSGQIELSGYSLSQLGDMRVSYDRLNVKTPVNSTAELMRLLAVPALPADLLRGCWTHHVDYRRLVHLPLGTERFLEIRALVADAYVNKGGWEAALQVIESLHRTEDNLINKAVTARINELMVRRMIPSDDLGYKLTLDNLGDLRELNDPNCGAKVAQMAGYGTRLSAIITKVFAEFFIADTVIDENDPHLGDVIACADVHYYKNGTNKTDLVSLADPDHATMIKEILAANTVMRHSRQAIVSNGLPDEAIMIAAVRTAGAALEARPETAVVPSALGQGQMGVIDSILATQGDKLADVEDVLAVTGKQPASKLLVQYRCVTTMGDGMRLIPAVGTMGWL